MFRTKKVDNVHGESQAIHQADEKDCKTLEVDGCGLGSYCAAGKVRSTTMLLVTYTSDATPLIVGHGHSSMS
jgi:hypothetical protein